MSSAIITMAYLLFIVFFNICESLTLYVDLFLHNYCTFPYGIKSINRICFVVNETVGK